MVLNKYQLGGSSLIGSTLARKAPAVIFDEVLGCHVDKAGQRTEVIEVKVTVDTEGVESAMVGLGAVMRNVGLSMTDALAGVAAIAGKAPNEVAALGAAVATLAAVPNKAAEEIGLHFLPALQSINLTAEEMEERLEEYERERNAPQHTRAEMREIKREKATQKHLAWQRKRQRGGYKRG